MAVEMPVWCGACDPVTRRFNLGDVERRCPECHPFWAFGHSSVDPARVPVGRIEQERAVRWLLYELVSLRALPTGELSARVRPFFEQGWTLLDIVHALDFDPDSSQVKRVPAPDDPARLVARRVLNLLAAWCDEHGHPLASPSQLAEARTQRLRQRQQAARAYRAEIAARPPNPEGATRSGARQIAAEARAKARSRDRAGHEREQQLRAQELAGQEAAEKRIRQTMRQLDKFKFGVVAKSRDASTPHEGPADGKRAAA